MKKHLYVIPEQKDSLSSSLYSQFEQYIALEQFSQAEELLTAHRDEYLFSLYIQALYELGHRDLVKQQLLNYDPTNMINHNVRSHAYFQMLWIKAEICYDEGRYDDAIKLYEEITIHHPHVGQAKYALASCFLHETRHNLQQRISLYHPSPEEKMKIDKYIANLTESIEILNSTGWHTNQKTR